MFFPWGERERERREENKFLSGPASTNKWRRETVYIGLGNISWNEFQEVKSPMIGSSAGEHGHNVVVVCLSATKGEGKKSWRSWCLFVTLEKASSWLTNKLSCSVLTLGYWSSKFKQRKRENYSNGTQTKRFFPPSRPFHSLSSQEEEEEVKKQIEMKSKANGRRAHTRQWGRRFLPWRQQFRLRGIGPRAIEQFFYRRSRPPAAHTVDCFISFLPSSFFFISTYFVGLIA